LGVAFRIAGNLVASPVRAMEIPLQFTICHLRFTI